MFDGIILFSLDPLISPLAMNIGNFSYSFISQRSSAELLWCQIEPIRWVTHRVSEWVNISNVFSRPYWVVRSRLWYDVLSVCPSVVCLSVTFCIVAKRYVVEGRRWYRWIVRW